MGSYEAARKTSKKVINFFVVGLTYGWENIGKYVFLAMFLCGVLLPIYVVGKKYE